jgi:pimeloyl-ACP methyl ester carboxylesterase
MSHRSSDDPTVLVLSGLGLTAAVAARVVAALPSDLRIIRVPFRDADGDRDTRIRADAAMDPAVGRAVAALAAAGAETAHVVGLSVGGMVAQELAIRHPEIVRSLVLGATSVGGELCVPPEEPVRDLIDRLDELPAEEGLWACVPYLYAPRTRHRHAPRIGEDIARRASEPLDPAWFRGQRAISRSHDAGARLAAITAPTLVVHGEEDRILPPENGRRLAAAIAGAQLITLPHGAHAFPTDAPEVGRELVRFLRAQSRPRRTSPRHRTARADRA